MKIRLIVVVLLFAACAPRPGRWHWQHPDPLYSEQNRARDIAECEEYALDAEMDGKGHLLLPARDYGGWGNFSFEFCMQQRGWHLEFIEPPR